LINNSDIQHGHLFYFSPGASPTSARSFPTTLLFEIKPFDFLTYAAVAALLLAIALAACYLPGRRAMRIDPAVALRIE